MMEEISHASNGVTADSVSHKLSKQERELEKQKLAKAKRRQKVSNSCLKQGFRFIVEQRIEEEGQARLALERN